MLLTQPAIRSPEDASRALESLVLRRVLGSTAPGRDSGTLAAEVFADVLADAVVAAGGLGSVPAPSGAFGHGDFPAAGLGLPGPDGPCSRNHGGIPTPQAGGVGDLGNPAGVSMRMPRAVEGARAQP